MHISVHFGEPYWRSTGQRELHVEIEEGARLANLMALLRVRHPALDSDLAETVPMVFVDEVEVGPEARLEDGSRVHLVWPLAGG